MFVRPDPITQIVNRIGTVNYIYQPVLTWFEFCRSVSIGLLTFVVFQTTRYATC